MKVTVASHHQTRSKTKSRPIRRRDHATVETVLKSPTDQDVPDLSGFTKFEDGKLLAVRDTKLEDDSSRLLVLDESKGSLDPVDVDWSETGRARDLEAIAPGPEKGQFLAVEGSSWKEHKARLFELSVDKEGAKAEKSHVLPEFGQEIEGLVTIDREDGHQTLLLAGRGGDGQRARIYWGELNDEGIAFSEAGLKGKAVKSPVLGHGQRGVADLAKDENGGLWASATVDDGDNGPFRSMVYQLGEVTPEAKTPFKTNLGRSFKVEGIKAEALTVTPQGTLFVGSDDEALGGQMGHLHTA